MSASSRSHRRSLLRLVPGLLISIFFLWYTFRDISFAQIRTVRVVHPAWWLGIVFFTYAACLLRCVRWHRMLRSTSARFLDSARVLMTSFAANNILPFRIGDIMRIFTYAPDLGTSPSVILSTVIFEKLLDVFVLVLFFVVSMGPRVGHHSRVMAASALGFSTVGLLAMILGARTLEPLLCRWFDRWSGRISPSSKLRPYLQKVEHWILLAFDCIRQIGIVGSLWLLVLTVVAWIAEGMIYVSGMHLIGLAVDFKGPWLAVSFANLSFLIPSTPGGIGAFEWAVKTSLVSHGAPKDLSALFGLALHAWILISITAAGGAIFLIHRIRVHSSTPLLEEIEALPIEMP